MEEDNRNTVENKIWVASRDFYTPNSDWEGSIEDFDWDIQDNNRFDERIKTFLEVNGSIIVEQIESDGVGGLKVVLSGGYTLEVFLDSSENNAHSEHWRFFRKDNSPHFVITGSRIEMV
ncbi:hypothetical protein [Bacillus sp. 1NLA3E]|uniref:hypothetical protein n=1 Tax=Bacillus sp. 1NLA3E TaxID=666686 RepID=UPI000247F487|nr:hypothetical protein [Bacillus sp. 1NLA3E]AGK55271.1 hypothetical protein B1NLA3E_17635 [Bacillus sp. 1NLA3E]